MKLTSRSVLNAVAEHSRRLADGSDGHSSEATSLSPERWRQHAEVVELIRDQVADHLPDPTALVLWLRSGSHALPTAGVAPAVATGLLLVAASVEFYVRGVEHGRKTPRA